MICPPLPNREPDHIFPGADYFFARGSGNRVPDDLVELGIKTKVPA